jgi:hypothetical protein
MVPPPQHSTRYYSKEKAYKVGWGEPLGPRLRGDDELLSLSYEKLN